MHDDVAQALAEIEEHLVTWERCIERIERAGRDVDELEIELLIKRGLEDQLRDLVSFEVMQALLGRTLAE